MDKNTRGVLLVLSGPSGTGKGTVCKVVRDSLGDNLAYSISATTRKPRTGEEHGREYFFFTKEEFEDLRDKNGFLEWAQVYDNYYGTPRAFVEEVLASGRDCILEIDPQGALQVRKATDEAVLVFIAPPSLEELRSRLTGRGTEAPEEVEKRLSCAEAELSYSNQYDYLIVNDEVEKAADKMKAILMAERCRIKRG
ncbi:MAG: guanylate kinase [Peptococcaceae bacterium]|jgi:guanylate kinase|nr:guanylate kinase [Peptococcaceae bacterium]MBQ2004985.1 guanylate kinase [Peptococcaceae bacterium]MBQ2368685.1 guanylate kinase [Peptococcaceae bacterium]MBQ2431693.1 guanylate kinase [Peptococcaceae bacterium]MBQ5369474.1 guanylate kinase [Peptococcaceae bacterium]